jgi:hypothetical protein
MEEIEPFWFIGYNRIADGRDTEDYTKDCNLSRGRLGRCLISSVSVSKSHIIRKIFMGPETGDMLLLKKQRVRDLRLREHSTGCVLD